MSQMTRSRLVLVLFAVLVLATLGYRTWVGNVARQPATSLQPTLVATPRAPTVLQARPPTTAPQLRPTTLATLQPSSGNQASRPTARPTRTPRPTRVPTAAAPPAPQATPRQQTAPLVRGMKTASPDQLPPQAQHTLALIAQGGPFPYRRDGVVFENREGRLPRHPSGYYHEYTVETPGSDDRGARRIIAGANGELFYTGDHYSSFVQVSQQ